MASKQPVMHPEAYEAQLQTNAGLGWTAADIVTANKERLLTMQHRLGLGSEWGVIEFPKAFMPAGRGHYTAFRFHRLPQFLPQGAAINAPCANDAWTEVLRFVIARLTQIGPRNSKIVSYSTCVANLNTLKPIVRKIVMTPAAEGHFWGRVGEEASAAKSRTNLLIFSAQRHYHKIGALPDEFRGSLTIEADEPERDRAGEGEHEASVEGGKQWQPLPMDFVSEMGWRSLRLIKSVAPTLLDALDAALRVPPVTQGLRGQPLKKGTVRARTLQARDKVIAGWQWRDDNGAPLYDLEFEFYRNSKRTGVPIAWPPRTFGQAMRLAHALVKPAHLWMVLLGNGNRNSEAVSMRDDCLVPATKGNFRWKGRTFKMTGITGGCETEAVVPEIIGQSILQQKLIAQLTKQDKGFAANALWVGEIVEAVLDLSSTLNSYVDALGLRHLLGEENPSCHEHRFRKTLAWIVAVSLTNSIMILKDCFGHTDAVMTLLSYIASNPSIAQEVIKVQKELTIMMAVDVITNRETIGGPGAPALRQRADAHLKRIGKSKFEPQDAYEFARRETFEGRAWMMIAPGILCTAPHDMTQVSTPCALGQKRHNPANCKTGCDWQLLLHGVHATQADDTVDYALKNLQQAIDRDDEASIAFWAGQAKAWLYRYDEVAEKWKDHPLVVAYVPRPVRIMMKAAA